MKGSWFHKRIFKALLGVALIFMPACNTITNASAPAQGLLATQSVLQATQSSISTQIQTIAGTPSSQVAEKMTPTHKPPKWSVTATLPSFDGSVASNPGVSKERPEIVWSTGYENGNIEDWQKHGDFVSQGYGGSFHAVTPHAHTGKYSVALKIDTLVPTDTGSQAAYLFYWDPLPGAAYYYSSWYYIPSSVRPKDWWNIWQWKSTYNGNSDRSVPMWSLGVTLLGDGLQVGLTYRPDDEQKKVPYFQNVKSVPTDRWFQIEGYYKKALDKSGQVIIWLDGVEIFRVDGVQTVENDKTVLWSINNYAASIEPNPCTIFVDDAIISKTRIGPDFRLTE